MHGDGSLDAIHARSARVNLTRNALRLTASPFVLLRHCVSPLLAGSNLPRDTIARDSRHRAHATRCSRGNSSREEEWVGADLNCRPPPCQGGVITRLDHQPGVLRTSPNAETREEEWVGADLNCRPPPCQGGVITRLDHQPGYGASRARSDASLRCPGLQFKLSNRTTCGDSGHSALPPSDAVDSPRAVTVRCRRFSPARHA